MNFADDNMTIQYYRDPCERHAALEWYSDHELSDMKQQAMDTACAALSCHDHHIMTWPRALGVAYHAFVHARAVHELNGTLAMVTRHVHLLADCHSIELLGLEKWTVPGFRRDRTRRRHALAREIQYWASRRRHNHGGGDDYDYVTAAWDDESEDNVTMGDVCREISRSSRMFAFHTGRMLAMQVEADEQ